MLVVFTIDGDREVLYITTPDDYSNVLKSMHVDESRVTFQNVKAVTWLTVIDKAVRHVKLGVL